MSRQKNTSAQKLCLKCNVLKNKEHFYIHKQNGLSAYCKDCSKEQVKEYRKKNPEKIKSLKEKYKETRKEIRKPTERRNHLKIKYGITEIEYEKMFNNQDGKCLLCDKKCDYRKLHIDHCHSTGKIRGLLCSNCNLGLGNFKDNIETLKKAIEYLK